MAIRKPNNAESFREQLRKNGLFEPDKSVPKQEPPKTLCVVSPQVGGYHGLWSRRFIVAYRHSTADYSVACSVHAPLEGGCTPSKKALGSPGAFLLSGPSKHLYGPSAVEGWLILREKNTNRRTERPVQPFLSKVEFDTSTNGLFDHTLDHDVSKTFVFRRYH
jgi:hypothetical protein